MAGVLWRFNFLKAQNMFKVPEFLARLCSSTIGRLLRIDKAVHVNTSQMGATPGNLNTIYSFL